MITRENYFEPHIRDLQAAICIGSRGKLCQEDFPSYLNGTREIVTHIYERGFSMEVAARMAPKVIYLAACLLTGEPFDRNADFGALKKELPTQEDLQTMKALRKARTNEYGYLILADRLLKRYRDK